MTDQPSPFDPTPLPAATPEPEKPKRRQNGKRPGRPAAAKPATEVPKRRGRPASTPKTKVPVSLKVDFSTALAVAADLKPEDTELFGQMAVALNRLGKKPRARIAAALGKMFG